MLLMRFGRKIGSKASKLTFLGHFAELGQKWRKSQQILQQFSGYENI